MPRHLQGMEHLRRALAAPALAAASLILLVGCASLGRKRRRRRFGEAYPQPPDGEVVGQGTVMDVARRGRAVPRGRSTESYPPQCSGIPLAGWSWQGVDGSETSGDVRWGTYAVQGTYDGETLTVTAPPIMLALYDPMPLPDPDGRRARPGRSRRLFSRFRRNCRIGSAMSTCLRRSTTDTSGSTSSGTTGHCRMPRMPSSAWTPWSCAPHCGRWSSASTLVPPARPGLI